MLNEVWFVEEIYMFYLVYINRIWNVKENVVEKVLICMIGKILMFCKIEFVIGNLVFVLFLFYFLL